MEVLIPLLAFIGGVAAVAAKGWLDYILERRRERAQLRSAARLIAGEFSGIAIHVQTVEELGKWQELDEWGFDHDAWRENKALLAANLSYLDWITVSMAYRSVRTYESFPTFAQEENAAPWPMLVEGQILFLGLYRKDFVRAQGALVEAAGSASREEAPREPTPFARFSEGDEPGEVDEAKP